MYMNSTSAPPIRWTHSNGVGEPARSPGRPLPAHKRLARVAVLFGVVPFVVVIETTVFRVAAYSLYGAPWFFSRLGMVDYALILFHVAVSLTFGVLGILFALRARSAARAMGVPPRGIGAVGITLGMLHSLNVASGVIVTFVEW